MCRRYRSLLLLNVPIRAAHEPAVAEMQRALRLRLILHDGLTGGVLAVGDEHRREEEILLYTDVPERRVGGTADRTEPTQVRFDHGVVAPMLAEDPVNVIRLRGES